MVWPPVILQKRQHAHFRECHRKRGCISGGIKRRLHVAVMNFGNGAGPATVAMRVASKDSPSHGCVDDVLVQRRQWAARECSIPFVPLLCETRVIVPFVFYMSTLYASNSHAHRAYTGIVLSVWRGCMYRLPLRSPRHASRIEWIVACLT